MNPTEKIYQEAQKLVEHYIESLNKYSEEGFFFKKNEDIWSIGQMYEHLLTSSKFFLKQASYCLEEKKGEMGGSKNETGEKMYHHGTFPPIKIKVPEAWKGPDPEAQAKDHYRLAFPEIIGAMGDMKEKIANNEGTYKINHAVCGPLNAQEWYQMLEMHLRHHLRQQEELESYIETKA